VCYHNGAGVPRNQAKFIFWAGEAAAQGNANAQFGLGEAYRAGEGVPKNKDIAMSWYRRAATNDHPHACYILALGLLEEKTNHEAQIEAYRYMLQAAQAGHREAHFVCVGMFARRWRSSKQ